MKIGKRYLLTLCGGDKNKYGKEFIVEVISDAYAEFVANCRVMQSADYKFPVGKEYEASFCSSNFREIKGQEAE